MIHDYVVEQLMSAWGINLRRRWDTQKLTKKPKKKNGVGQQRQRSSCCLSLSFYAKKEERLSIAEEAGKRSLCFRAVSLETRPWEEKLTSKARKLSLLRKRSASHPHLACSSPCPEPLFAFCFFDFRDWVSPFLFLRGNKAFSSVQQ